MFKKNQTGTGQRQGEPAAEPEVLNVGEDNGGRTVTVNFQQD